MDTQDSPQPGLGGSHHLPPYSIFCGWPRRLHPNAFSLPGLPSGSPEIAPNGTLTTLEPHGALATLEPHNFARKPQIAMWSKTKL